MKIFFTRLFYYINYFFSNFYEKKNLINYEKNNFNRISLINFAVMKFGLNCKYLEIGVFQDTVFNSIPLTLDKKIGVDPVRGGTHKMTSDEFFAKNNLKFDVIFIDGLHTYDQVLRDFINSYNSLSANGIIFIHDILPFKEIYQERTRRTSIWNGDVWKLGFQLSNAKKNFIISNIDFGVGIFKKKQSILNLENLNKKKFFYKKLNYPYYKNKHEKLPIKSVFQCINFICEN